MNESATWCIRMKDCAKGDKKNNIWIFDRIPADLRTVFHPLLRIQHGGNKWLLEQMLDSDAFVSRKGASVVEN